MPASVGRVHSGKVVSNLYTRRAQRQLRHQHDLDQAFQTTPLALDLQGFYFEFHRPQWRATAHQNSSMDSEQSIAWTRSCHLPREFFRLLETAARIFLPALLRDDFPADLPAALLADLPAALLADLFADLFADLLADLLAGLLAGLPANVLSDVRTFFAASGPEFFTTLLLACSACNETPTFSPSRA